MQYVYPFLRSSTIVDFAFILLVIMIGFALIPAAVAILVKAKSRKPVYILITLAFVPLVIGLLGGAWRYYHAMSFLAEYRDLYADQSGAFQEVFRREFLIMCIIGLAGSVVPFLAGIAGLLVKKTSSDANSE